MTDAELLKLVQSGDREAVETLYNRCLPSVWRYVSSRVGGQQHAAEDIVSETFLAALRGASTYMPGAGTIMGWLVGIARHKLADHLRRRTLESNDFASVGISNPACDVLDTRDQVRAVLDQMQDDECQVLEWKYLEELSVAVMAKRIGRSEKAVEALLYRARCAFRELMKPDTN